MEIILKRISNKQDAKAWILFDKFRIEKSGCYGHGYGALISIECVYITD
jgi:hypothetical protein